MKPGEVYRRVKERQQTFGFMRDQERLGDLLEIEEAPLPQGGNPEQARAVFRSGAREGQKVQYAISFIESDFTLVTGEEDKDG